MQKKNDNFFEKIVKKDYNNELEKVLEKKYFEENAKSLLLNILYKIEAAYKDYEKVKRDVETKEEFIQNIINIVEKDCTDIKLVKPNSEESQIIGNKTFLVEKRIKRIICYPIERKLLYSIAKIEKKDTIIKDEYFLINKTLSNLINVGNSINTVEVLRDFNGYSWTTIPREIESINHNLIYQNLRMLIGNKFLKDWINNKEFIMDYFDFFKSKLEQKYSKKEQKNIIDVISKLSILLEVKFDKKSEKEILKLKKQLEEKAQKIQDNKEFVKSITDEKRILTNQIRSIDETINNRQKLQEEYERRNQILPIDKKIFSARILSNIMEEERDKKIKELGKLNTLLNPKKFVKYKKELEEKKKLLDLLDTEDIDKDIQKLIAKLQKVFLNCYEKRVEEAKTKSEIIDLIYEYRYYCMLPYNLEKNIYEVKTIEKDVEKIGRKIINKAHELKVINIFSKNENIDYLILKNIFLTRIISLEELNIKITKEKNQYYIQLLDENIFDEKIEIKDTEEFNKKVLGVRLNKKVAVFN